MPEKVHEADKGLVKIRAFWCFGYLATVFEGFQDAHRGRSQFQKHHGDVDVHQKSQLTTV